MLTKTLAIVFWRLCLSGWQFFDRRCQFIECEVGSNCDNSLTNLVTFDVKLGRGKLHIEFSSTPWKETKVVCVFTEYGDINVGKKKLFEFTFRNGRKTKVSVLLQKHNAT